MSIAGIAFRTGRRIGKHPLAGMLFCLSERWLPLKKIAREDGLVAFHHPRPIADPHVLIVPTRPVASLTTNRIDDTRMAAIIWKMVELGRDVTSQLPASENWQMVINGGERQDIGQLHAHLLHAGETHSQGISLTNPEREPGNWQRIFTDLRDADRLPGNGYTLEFGWSAGEDLTAEVTQSTRTY